MSISELLATKLHQVRHVVVVILVLPVVVLNFLSLNFTTVNNALYLRLCFMLVSDDQSTSPGAAVFTLF